MTKHNKKKKSRSGKGLINSVIDKIPFEMHLPGYQFCGPGTKVDERVARGDVGINALDAACKDHDIVYNKHKDKGERLQADKQLLHASLKRINSKSASLTEKAAAIGVSAAMKTKIGLSKVGYGLKITNNIKNRLKVQKKKNCINKSASTFRNIVKSIKHTLKQEKPENTKHAITTALLAAKHAKKLIAAHVQSPRIIPIPKTGGMLPLIPIFAGLSALGSLAGGTAGVVRAIGSANEAKRQLEESKRHNDMMEAIAIGKSKKGSGLFLKPYRNGYGLYLKPYALEKNV